MADHDYWATGGGRLKGKLGEDDEWLREKLRQASDPENERKREFLNQWTLRNDSGPMTSETLSRVGGSLKTTYLDTDGSPLASLVNATLDSIKDRSHCDVNGPFTWTCIARYPDVMMFSDHKRCRYCKPTEEHEDDHPLFWRGGHPILNDDLS